MIVAFEVRGIPAPQGSKRGFVVNGRAVLVESSAKVKPWREDVRQAAITAMAGRPALGGAVNVSIVFSLPKPKSTKRVYPSVRPDLDKLCRSTLDALTSAGVFSDDAQVVTMAVSKMYGDPGAHIIVGDYE